MYAVIETGGKQYRVKKGEQISVEKMPLEAGKTVEFDKVLLVKDGEKLDIGQPTLKGAKVKGKVVEQTRAGKINIVKFKRRKHHLKWQGHRQPQTNVEITEIEH